MKEVKTKKVIAEIYDPFRDARGNNVFHNINIADTIAQQDQQTLNQLVQSSRNYSASQRSEQQIKNSLRSISS
jgi:DNA-binding protein YbaB